MGAEVLIVYDVYYEVTYGGLFATVIEAMRDVTRVAQRPSYSPAMSPAYKTMRHAIAIEHVTNMSQCKPISTALAQFTNAKHPNQPHLTPPQPPPTLGTENTA